MKFTLELEPGSTYDTLARRLAEIAGKLNGVNQKPEHAEECEIRECGVIVARWGISK